jgi:hypothetical protein
LRRSAIADAAALRLAERTDAELDAVFEPSPRAASARVPVVPSCAMAEGAALRWLDQHPSEPEPC